MGQARAASFPSYCGRTIKIVGNDQNVIGADPLLEGFRHVTRPRLDHARRDPILRSEIIPKRGAP
ncbi:hypothetical protein MESS4_690090 [Mesorhizobium sp. STM 4661]|nr:hypothetical protein MESS4_690090 [Mesorhizobium sp. STM 4661]